MALYQIYIIECQQLNHSKWTKDKSLPFKPSYFMHWQRLLNADERVQPLVDHWPSEQAKNLWEKNKDIADKHDPENKVRWLVRVDEIKEYTDDIKCEATANALYRQYKGSVGHGGNLDSFVAALDPNINLSAGGK